MTGVPIRIPLYFAPPIMAFDQDSLNASLVYDIISGNERQLFRVNPHVVSSSCHSERIWLGLGCLVGPKASRAVGKQKCLIMS